MTSVTHTDIESLRRVVDKVGGDELNRSDIQLQILLKILQVLVDIAEFQKAARGVIR